MNDDERRLAEIKGIFTRRVYGERPEVREAGHYLLDRINSLTVERNAFREGGSRYAHEAAVQEARAEAAEAEVKRLREALDELLDNFDWIGTGTRAQGELAAADFFARYPTVAAWRDGTVATPPSEGGQA